MLNLFFLLRFPAVGLNVVPRAAAAGAVAGGVDRVLGALHGAAVPLHARGGAPAPRGVLRGAARRYLVLCVLGERPLFASRRMTLGTWAVRGDRVRVGWVLLLGVHDRARARRLCCGQWDCGVGGRCVTAVRWRGRSVLSLVTLVPSFVYWAEHGRNDVVATGRLRIGALRAQCAAVLPIEQHRIGELAHCGSVRREVPADRGGANTALGTWRARAPGVAPRVLRAAGDPGRRFAGTAGRAGVAALLLSCSRGPGGSRPSSRRSSRRSAPGTGCVSSSGSWADAGGSVRWALGWLRGRWSAGAGVGLAVLALVSCSAGSTRRVAPTEPAYAALRPRTASDGDFVRGIEAQVPRGSMIFQLPHRVREAPRWGPWPTTTCSAGTCIGRPALELRIVKGRGDDWSANVAREPVPQMVRE